jgi:hypothetical protein
MVGKKGKDMEDGSDENMIWLAPLGNATFKVANAQFSEGSICILSFPE